MTAQKEKNNQRKNNNKYAFHTINIKYLLWFSEEAKALTTIANTDDVTFPTTIGGEEAVLNLLDGSNKDC